MLEKTPSATRLAREKMSINLFSLFTSMVMQMPVTMTMVGTMPRVMSVSFHWTMKATTKAATNVEQLWTKTVRRSEMPLVTRLPLVVTLTDGEPASSESKKVMSWRRRLCRKSMRSALVARMAPMDTSTVWV